MPVGRTRCGRGNSEGDPSELPRPHRVRPTGMRHDRRWRPGQAAESVDHHPDVDWRYDHVFVRSTTHQVGDEVTERDIRLATRISSLAAGAGAVAEPTLVRTVEIGMDSADPAALRSTWQTALD